MTEIKGRDYVIAVDRSGSMSEADCDGTSRWGTCKESVKAACNHLQQYDPDGVDLYFYNASFKKIENVTSDKIDQEWNCVSPMGGTKFAPVLKDAFDNHFKKQERPTTILFITDGEAHDRAETEKVIKEAANKLEHNDELCVSFLQIGKDRSAGAFLKSLDDDLQSSGAKLILLIQKQWKRLRICLLTMFFFKQLQTKKEGGLTPTFFIILFKINKPLNQHTYSYPTNA